MKLFEDNNEIKALSWKQPFAELMLYGKIETRTWNTNYRGWVLICSSKKPYNGTQVLDIAGFEQYTRICENIGKCLLGKAIAIGKLVDCRPMRKEDEDKCFVKFNLDLYCHIYEDVQEIIPFDWKGSQRWKKVPQSITIAIKEKFTNITECKRMLYKNAFEINNMKMTHKELGQPKTIGELREMIKNYDDNIPFGFRNQPMQTLGEAKWEEDNSTFVSFQ